MFLSILLLAALLAQPMTGLDSDVGSNPPASSMRALVDMIPAGAVAVSVFPGPSPSSPGEAGASTAQGGTGTPSSSPLPLAGLLLDQADRMGLFAHVGDQVRAWTHVLAAMAVLCDYPHAVAILGASARARPGGGHQLSGLRAALIIRTDGQNDWVTKRIQHLINTYANDQETSLKRRTVSGQTAVTLRDRRLPSWATMTWGAIGDHYVITIGTGAFERIAKASAGRLLSLGRDPWALRALDATEASAATWSIFVRFESLLQGADRSLARKIDGVQTSLHLDDIDRGFWTYRRDGRSIEISGYERRNGHDASILIAGKHHLRAVGRAVIPDEASTYAIIQWNPRAAVRGACNAYLASEGPRARQSSRAFWRTIETESGVSIENDIVAHLGQYIIMHDDPKPFLGLPIARTIVIPINGDAKELARRVDQLLEYARKRLDEADWFQIQHDPDGTWYLQLGLLGPALRVTDHWLVISFSPEAVRHNVARLSRHEPAESTPNPGPSDQPE